MPNRFCLCWAFCVETFHQRRKEYWAMYCTPFCGFIKKYNMVGMAMSWLQSCWERRIFCHKLATILPRYSILVPRHVAAKVVNKKYSKYWAYILARKHCFFACFKPFFGLPDNHINWATLMPFASIYQGITVVCGLKFHWHLRSFNSKFHKTTSKKCSCLCPIGFFS